MIIWERTEEYKKEYEEAKQKFSETCKKLFERGFSCTYLGSLRFDNNGYPEVWLNDCKPLQRQGHSVDNAKKLALKYGHLGWWNLDQLAEFAEGKGPIFEQAMHAFCYRKHKKDKTKWAKITWKESMHSSQLAQQLWHEANDKSYSQISEDETKRLQDLLTMPNESAGISRTYTLSVGKRGMIYVELWANPFAGHSAEKLHFLGEQINDRGHYAKQQEGYKIDAVNINLKISETKNKDIIYIKAIKPDETFVECVWPSIIPKEKIIDLEYTLESKFEKEFVD